MLVYVSNLLNKGIYTRIKLVFTKVWLVILKRYHSIAPVAHGKNREERIRRLGAWM